MKYEIPADLKCSSCTLQWQWFTANSCTPGEDTGCYWADFAAKGWDRAAWCGDFFCGSCSSLLQANSSSTLGTHSVRGCGEEFRNCADIAVVDDAGGAITAPSTSSEDTSSSSEGTSSSTSQQSSCSDVWGTCGGNGWKGPFCCKVGSSCVEQSEWYSQCKPGPEGTSSGTSQQSSCSDVWGTCGGNAWKGPFCCKAGSSCVEQSEWYSQCKPSPVSPTQSSSSEELQATEKASESSEPVSEPETEPEAESEHEDKDVSSSVAQCGSCSGCLSNGFCCKETSKSVCESYPKNTWCGASRALLQRKKQQFLGLGLIQDGASRARGSVSDEL